MASVFPTNAILEFPQLTGMFTEHPLSGNWVPQKGSSLIIEASLVAIERTIEVDEREGINRTLILMRGHLTKPKKLPLTLEGTENVSCTIIDRESGHNQVGRFLVRSIVQSRWKPVTKALGAKIEGYFEVAGGSEF